VKLIREIPNPTPVEYPAVAFLSIAPHDGGYIGAYREFDPPLSNVKTRIRTQRYTPKFALDGPSVPMTIAGEDPRTFRWRDSVWSLIELPKNGTADCVFVLIDLVTLETIYLSHDLEYAGKNWMPVVGREQLYIVRSLDPLSILIMHDDGRCERVVHNDREIGARRGGANARFESDRIIGYGHETRNADNHVPFFFSIDMDSFGVDVTYPILGPVLSLVDPTAFWDDTLLCCLSRVNWWVEQPIIHQLFDVSTRRRRVTEITERGEPWGHRSFVETR
jgi:hypothetical protein